MSTEQNCTAFRGNVLLAAGPRLQVAQAIKKAGDLHEILAFDDETGRVIDFNVRGSDADVVARYSAPTRTAPEPSGEESSSEPRGRGRPRLGVVAREVTLLPRHWEWLAAQPGGASVALRRLVEEARRANGDRDRHRAARDAAYHFMSAMAGNFEGFEEASRALFADDRRRFGEIIAPWPADIRDHIVRLAYDPPGA